MYCLFNLLIDSEVVLPEATTDSGPRSSELRIVNAGKPLGDCKHIRWVHRWRHSDNTISIACGRLDSDYLLRFPDQADFRIAPGASLISCYPRPGCSSESLGRLLTNQVIPRWLGHQGCLALHASAIRMPGRGAIALVGHSSIGKSSLAVCFCQRGAQLISDDCVLLEQLGSDSIQINGLAGLRLWSDSAAALLPHVQTSSDDCSEKRRYLLGNETTAGPVPLAAIFILAEHQSETVASRIDIRPLGGAHLLMSMLERLFIIDPLDRETLGRQFCQIGNIGLVSARAFSLTYPRDYAVLPDVCDAIMAELTPQASIQH